MLEVEPRSVTAEEVAFYRERGWVKLDRLITEQAASALLGRLQEKMGADASIADRNMDRWNALGPIAVDEASGDPADELFYACSHAPTMGELGSTLLGKPVRYWMDQALVKMPGGRDGSAPTPWHSDIGSRPQDRPFDPGPNVDVAELTVWVALDAIPPERGSLRFVSPSSADQQFRATIEQMDVPSSYRALEQRGILSPPLYLRPGDATAHGDTTWHSALGNTTDQPRWGWQVTLFIKDALYTGYTDVHFHGVEGLEVGKEFVDHRFRVLA